MRTIGHLFIGKLVAGGSPLAERVQPGHRQGKKAPVAGRRCHDGAGYCLEPSEPDPPSALMVAQLALEAGVPPGVLNVVNGDKEAVDILLTDKRIAAVSFVGSTPIAEYVYATGCANGKRVQALGGAKNHAVVMPDADVANAVSAMMGAAYGSCGERCMAVPLIVAVGDQTADAMIASLRIEIAKMTVGPGDDATIDMGPLVTKPHF